MDSLSPNDVPLTILQRRGASHARTPSAPELAISTAPLPLRALLVGQSFEDENLRRAGCEMISKLKKKKKRNSDLASPRAGGTVSLRSGGRLAPVSVELHILILSKYSASATSPGRDDSNESTEQANKRSAVLAAFREAGAHCFVHVALTPSNRFSLTSTSFSDTLRDTIIRALQIGTLGKVFNNTNGGVEAAGLVCGLKDDGADKDQTKAFVQALASIFAASPPTATTTPSITLYLPKHPFLSDFDLDLPAEEVRSLRVASFASETFKAAFEKALHLYSPPMTSTQTSTSSASSSPDSGSSKRKSVAFLPPATASVSNPLIPPVSSNQRPLLLRPAPGAGAQSLTMRLSIGAGDYFGNAIVDPETAGRDVVLRVTEAQTPVVETNPFGSWSSKNGSASPTSAKGLRPLMLVPGSTTMLGYPSSASSGSSTRSSSPCSISSKRGVAPLHVHIPSPPLRKSFDFTTPSPNQLPSVFSPATPETPNPLDVSPPVHIHEEPAWDSKNYSPIQKIELIMENRKDTFDERPMSPVSKGVMDLLRRRVEKAESTLKGMQLSSGVVC